MAKINVIDLDQTLVQYDTFFLFIKRYARHLGWAHIFVYALLRRFDVISRAAFAKAIIKRCYARSNIEEIGSQYAQEIIPDLDTALLHKVDMHSDDRTTNILCTASPHFYVKCIASHLSWDAVASDFDSKGEFVHVYGAEKLQEIQRRYPADQYDYHYAMADSKSDLILLREFATYELLGKRSPPQGAVSSANAANGSQPFVNP